MSRRLIRHSEHIREKEMCKMNEKEKTMFNMSYVLQKILYADDIVLLSNDIDELSEIVNMYDATFKDMDLKSLNQ